MRIARNLFVISACALIFSVEAQTIIGCGLNKFRCANGECIANQFLCDGTAHCTDQSDETKEQCDRQEIVCSEYAFRCAYGACVDGDATCNGIKDCLDNSDETLPQCRETTIGYTTARPRKCSLLEFKCDNNQCIESSKLCDGRTDCADGSDETETQCGSISCPQQVFRCAYGACIDGDLKCNGEINCADSSDEDPLLCNTGIVLTTRRPVPTPTPTPTRRTTTPTTTRYPITPPRITTSTTPWTPIRSNCMAPPQPLNGHRKLHRSQCPGTEDCEVQQGTQLYVGSYLIYSCNRGYRLEGSEHVFCGPEGKWLNIPKCIEIRCRGLSSVSTEASCFFNNTWDLCGSPVVPGTTAELSCRVPSYREDMTQRLKQRKNVKCNENGEWEPEPIRCVPECGIINPKLGPLIVNGTTPSVPEFPWHATLYKAETPDSPKQFICGATIIQDNLLLTAAHCVYIDAEKKVDKAEKFFVATGNVFLDYDSPFHVPTVVKKRQVKNIYIACNYIGFDGNYAWDIAVLEISKRFVFTASLVPACLSPYGDQSVLEYGNYGKVAGFGRTEMGAQSSVLQSLTVPYVPTNQCKSASTTSSEKLITLDKFCAGYTNGSAVCDGDSGGGIVFKTGELWYIRGIVSLSLGVKLADGQRICDRYTYTLYTRVSSHISWIQDIILKLETYGSYPACPERRPRN